MKNKEYTKIISIIFIIVLIFSFFSGCINNDLNTNFSNTRPQLESIIINAPKKAYFGETIDFKLSGLKSDKKIVSYWWDFQDGEIANGKNVKHIYDLKNNLRIEYPVIYTVTLFVKYDDNSIGIKNHRIKLYPSNFRFYLQKNNLSENLPSSSREKISDKDFSFFDKKELNYFLDNAIYLDKCSWNITLYFEKPFLSNIREVRVIFYDDDGTKFKEKRFDTGFFNLGNEKTIVISGENKNIKLFKSMKLEIITFSLKDEIYLCYGGPDSSSIYFRFNR